MFADGDCVRGCVLVREAVQRGVSGPQAWKIPCFVFLKKPGAKLDKGLRCFRAIALLSVFSKWYTTLLVDLRKGTD